MAVECADPQLPQYKPGTDVYRNVLYRYDWCGARVHGLTVDLPCGMGWGTSLLSKRVTGKVVSVIGVDRNKIFLETARSRYPFLKFYDGNMLKMTFGDAHFDSIVCCEGLEHLKAEDVPKALVEFKRLLRPDGVLVGSVPLGPSVAPNQYHLSTWTESAIITEITKAGFKVRDIGRIYSMLLFKAERREQCLSGT